jgi:hypothetical protein
MSALSAILPGFVPTPLQAAAIRRIREYQQELKQQYGLFVRSSMELEFMVHDDQGILCPGAINMDKALERLNDSQKDNLPHIHKFEVEGEVPRRLHLPAMATQYEVSVDDKAGFLPIKEGKNPAFHPEEIAGVVQRLKTRSIHEILKDSSCLGTMVAFANFACRPTFEAHPTFNEPKGSASHTTETSALHINVSLTDVKGRSMFRMSDALLNRCAHSMLEVQKEASLALLPKPESLHRIGANSSVPGRLGIALSKTFAGNKATSVAIRNIVPSDKHPDELRIENRLPGADADPFVGMALTMAALVDGVRKSVQLAPAADNKSLRLKFNPAPAGLLNETAEIPADHQTQVERIRHSHAMRELLGAPLHSAILKEYGAAKAAR